MSPLILEGVTLGHKHKHYNRVVKATTADEKFILEGISYDDNDIDNLLKIDVACARRDVGYVLEVLRGGDALYVARALRRSAWLLADDEYAHIINPHHLHQDLFPKITTKVKSRLLLAIRLNLNNEARVDKFYDFFKDDTKFAQKWLFRCSDALVMRILEKDAKNMDVNLMKRLCRKSLAILKACCEICPSPHWLKSGKAFLYIHTEGYLELLSAAEENNVPKFGKKATRLLMNKYPETILGQFHKYCYKLDLPEFAKHLSTDAIRDILLKQILCDRYEVRSWCKYMHLEHLIRCIPEDQQYQFVQEIFLNKGKAEVSNDTNIEENDRESTYLYPWYCYVPFEIAFSKLKDLVFDQRWELTEGEYDVFELLEPIGSSNHSIRSWILNIVLVRSARGNLHHIQTLLHHYRDNHTIEPNDDDAMSSILCSITKTHKYDETTWNMLNEIFYGMGIYREDRNIIFPYCIQAIVLYNILHDKHIPKNIEQKIKLRNFRTLSQKLPPDESAKVFAYLYNYASKQLVTKELKHISELKVALSKCSELLWFLEAWKRDIAEFPLVVNKIRELIKIKNDNTWGTNIKLNKVFSQFYKEYRRLRIHLFQESLFLSLSDETCLNALKHDPDLFSRHNGWIEAIASTDAVSLRRTFMKLRIYWPHSMAKQWADALKNGLEQPTAAHKRCVEGHFILVTLKEALILVDKHIPGVFETDRKSANDSVSFNIPIYILLYMRLLRPAVSLGSVWSYVERGNLRSVVPLLDYVLINTCHAETTPYVTKLLNKTGPLQKLGIRYLCNQFDINKSKQTVRNVWNSNTSYSVKCGLFNHIFKFFIKAKKPDNIRSAWDIFSEIIDNLTTEFNESLKLKIDNIDKVPKHIRLNFIMKIVIFITSHLPTDVENSTFFSEYCIYARHYADHLNLSFVEKLLTITIDKYFNKASDASFHYRTDILRLLTAYLTTNDGIKDQQIKFEKLIVPLMERILSMWPDGMTTLEYLRNYRILFKRFLESLSLNVSKRLTSQYVVPVYLFRNLKIFINNKFSLKKDYNIVTFWNITVMFVDLLEDFSKNDTFKKIFDAANPTGYYKYQYENPVIEKIYSHIAPVFGKACINYFRQDDMINACPDLFLLASKSMMDAFISLSFPYSVINTTLKHMLYDENSSIFYILAIGVIRCMVVNSGSGEYAYVLDEELENMILSHPSKAVKTHYNTCYLKYDHIYSEDDISNWCRAGFMYGVGTCNDSNVY